MDALKVENDKRAESKEIIDETLLDLSEKLEVSHISAPSSSQFSATSLNSQRESDQRDADLPDDVDANEIAEIYRESEFLEFRQQYMDNLGLSKNVENSERSALNRILNGNQKNKSYVIKKIKKKEAVRRFREAKWQNTIENKIKIMYLEIKINEMNELKRQFMASLHRGSKRHASMQQPADENRAEIDGEQH